MKTLFWLLVVVLAASLKLGSAHQADAPVLAAAVRPAEGGAALGRYEAVATQEPPVVPSRVAARR